MENDIYHSCRYCKYYDGVHCNNKNFYIVTDDDIVDIDANLIVKEPDDFYCSNWE